VGGKICAARRKSAGNARTRSKENAREGNQAKTRDFSGRQTMPRRANRCWDFDRVADIKPLQGDQQAAV